MSAVNPETANCPRCKRANVSHRITCLYCGVKMPNPTAPPPPKADAGPPADLDLLVRQALTGKGDMRQLKAALQQKGREKARQASHKTPKPQAKQSTASPRRQASGTAHPPRQRSGSPAPGYSASNGDLSSPVPFPNSVAFTDDGADPQLGESLSQLQYAVDRALARWHAKDQAEMTVALNAAEKILRGIQENRSGHGTMPDLAALDDADGPSGVSDDFGAPGEMAFGGKNTPDFDLPFSGEGNAPPKPLTVNLPSYQNAYVLTVDGPGDTAMGPVLSELLEVDGLTARLHAASKHIRAVLRGNDRRALVKIAERVNHRTHLKAAVLAYATVRDLPPHLTVLRREGSHLEVIDEPIWLTDYQPNQAYPARKVLARKFDLAVPGEVIVKVVREMGQDGRGKRQRPGAQQSVKERRISLIDLYGDSRSFRVIVGITDYREMDGYTRDSALLSHKRFLSSLLENDHTWVEGNRICRPKAGAKPHQIGTQPHRYLTGWPSWEEHSRTCLLHHRQR